MSHPMQKVQIHGIQHRAPSAKVRKRWVVRWKVDGRAHSKAFATSNEANRYRSLLVAAHHRLERFDRPSGEPESWRPRADPTQVHAWCRRWIAEQWNEWQPRTRTSAMEALARFVALAVADGAPPPPYALRKHLVRTFAPGAEIDPLDECEEWLARWSLTLNDLDRSRLGEVDRRLGVGDGGQVLSPSSASRFRKVARACVRRAVELEVLGADPWPPAPKGRSRRKVARVRRSVDVRALPDPETMLRVIDAIPSHQPSSRMYQVMVAVMYYAGLRPSEVIMLRPSALHLPNDGWGRIDVREADISFDEPGEPKTGERTVPIPEDLVAILRDWIDTKQIGGHELLFRTRTDRRPTHSNWARTWQQALRQTGHRSLRVYDIRHAAATTWLAAGVPLGEVARRMGHSVETLVSTYVGALTGDETIANQRIDELLAKARKPDLKVVS
jgi:integrase